MTRSLRPMIVLAAGLCLVCTLAALYCYSSRSVGLRVLGLGLMLLAGLAAGFGEARRREVHSLRPNSRIIGLWVLGFSTLGLLGLLLPPEAPARVLRFLAVLLTKILRHL